MFNGDRTVFIFRFNSDLGFVKNVNHLKLDLRSNQLGKYESSLWELKNVL